MIACCLVLCGFPKGIKPFGSFLGYFLGKAKK